MTDFLESFMHFTAWPMEKPPAYGTFHLTFAFIGLALSFLLAWRLRNLSEKGNRILLTGCGLFLVITEIYKQLFYYYYIGGGSYQWWIFPFQLCSVPMYLCLIAPWLKCKKVQKGMYNFMMTFNLLGGLMAFIEPSGIVHEYWTLTLHAFVWHMLLVFIGLYLGLSKHGGNTVKDYRLAIITFLILCVIAFSLNLALAGVSGGSVNNFYIGPSISPLAVFHDIAVNFGWYVCTILYIPAVSAGAFLMFLPYYLLEKRKSKVTA
jgi:hypothetical protein